VIAFQWAHRVGIYYSGNGGIRGSTYTNFAGLCCHGNRCASNTQGRRELALLPQEAMESTIFPTCERQDTCCQRYRNVDFLYNACMVDALESCCAPASDDFLNGDACCVNHLSIGNLCSVDSECSEDFVCRNGLCDDPVEGLDICAGSWSPYTDCSATCGYGTQSRIFNVTQQRLTDSGVPCPVEAGHEDVRQCNRGPCGNVCEGMTCELADGESPCKERTGACVDVSAQYFDIKRAICQYNNLEDGTECPEGTCRSGTCVYTPQEVDVAETADDPDSDTAATDDYKTEFTVVLVLLIVFVLACVVYVAQDMCVSEDEDKMSTSNDVEVELESRRLPEKPSSPSFGAGDNMQTLKALQSGLTDDGASSNTIYDPIALEMKESQA
jgi:hypothetical protein